MRLLQGDNLPLLKLIEDNSVDAVVTDPPYGLSFMGKKWDYDVPSKELWQEVLRVLKPGGHLLSFSGTRTYHRMAVNIEDAGFEIRDMIEWVYSTGFPKSLNIGKAVDKSDGKRNTNTILLKNELNRLREEKGYSKQKMNELCEFEASNFFRTDNHLMNIFPTGDKWEKIKSILGDSEEIKNKIEGFYKEAEREVIGQTITNKTVYQNIGGTNISGEINITKGTSEWEGWGTALKPAHEPIVVARKPLSEKSVAENVLKWGTGGINIDESRVEGEINPKDYGRGGGFVFRGDSEDAPKPNTLGRFPANLIHDNSEEVRECFPETHSAGNYTRKTKAVDSWFGGTGNVGDVKTDFENGGSTARFFKSIIYQAKASKSERNKGCEGLEIKQNLQGLDNRGRTLEREDGSKTLVDRFSKTPATNNHPTVKPVALMEYLIEMVTPKGGTVLDPYMGSGTTGIACKQKGFDFIGMEMDAEYCKIAEARIHNTPAQQTLL